MPRILRPLLAFALLTLTAPLLWAEEIHISIFWQEGCPYCEQAREALADLAAEDPDIRLEELELGPSAANNDLFAAQLERFAVTRPGVPFVIIGGATYIGFGGARSTAAYREMIEACRPTGCPPLTATAAPVTAPSPLNTGPESIDLPLIGTLKLADLSLPALTVVLAAVDGFNPCAMWVLALLIALLLRVENSARMWTLGLVFLGATGVMYFAVMAAWLNIMLWIGAVAWLRLAIGLLAIGAGLYYLHDAWTNPEGTCRVTPSNRRKSINDAFRAMVEQPNLLIAALGIAALAIAVNLIELVCSAGVPAVYTQLLALQDLSKAAHYGYLLLYIAVFLIDDIAIFAIAMLTLRATFSSARVSRISHIIGGVVLLALGALMILRPDLLG